MNKHFEDSRYYARRVGEEIRAGVAEEFDGVRSRLAGLVDRSTEPEPSRLGAARERFETVVRRAETEVRGRVGQRRQA